MFAMFAIVLTMLWIYTYKCTILCTDIEIYYTQTDYTVLYGQEHIWSDIFCHRIVFFYINRTVCIRAYIGFAVSVRRVEKMMMFKNYVKNGCIYISKVDTVESH